MMDWNAIELLKECYVPASGKNWTGRQTAVHDQPLYWYQAVELVDALGGTTAQGVPDFALVGYACDEGVRRNGGRVGARNGPKEVRQRLAKMAYHHPAKSVIDLGDVACIEGNLEQCQQELAKVVAFLVSKEICPILIGGGHDIAYGHFLGIWRGLDRSRKPRIGILNFDAHFDLRPMAQGANSGTPFFQILAEHSAEVEYQVIGIQKQSNTVDLFDVARSHNVKYLPNFACYLDNVDAVVADLGPFLSRNDFIYVTIDLDGFSSAFAPGVSAPSPLGYSPFFLLRILEYLLQSRKVISLDIAELNPAFDRDNATANLAAGLIDFVVAKHVAAEGMAD